MSEISNCVYTTEILSLLSVLTPQRQLQITMHAALIEGQTISSK